MKPMERIKDLVTSQGLSQRELARRLNVSHVTVAKWLNGSFEPRGSNLEALAAFFKVTPAYILHGEQGVSLPTSLPIDDNVISIPVLDIKASCGDGIDSQSISLVKMLRVERDWLNARLITRANLSSLHIISADGDSMNPTINNGDFVFVDTSQKTISSDGIYALQYAGSIFIKRVLVKVNGGVSLISDNSRYKDQDINDTTQLNIIGRIVLIFNVREPI